MIKESRTYQRIDLTKEEVEAMLRDYLLRNGCKEASDALSVSWIKPAPLICCVDVPEMTITLELPCWVEGKTT